MHTRGKFYCPLDLRFGEGPLRILVKSVLPQLFQQARPGEMHQLTCCNQVRTFELGLLLLLS